jgi:hypothetical protein
MRSARRVASAPLVLALLAGCTAGSGPATQLPSEKRDLPEGTREPAPGGRNAPPPASDQDLGGSGHDNGTYSGGQCPACDFVYKCVQSDGISSVNESITLVNKNGRCVFLDPTMTAIFKCDRTVVILTAGQPTTIALWTPSGDGGFSVTLGQRDLVCVPDKPYVVTPVD